MKPIGIIAGTLIGLVVVTSSAFAFEKVGMQRNQARSQIANFDVTKATERLKEDVASGKITQEKADEMLAKMKEKTAEFATKKAEMIAKQKERIAKELADGKITQEQADKALARLADGKLMMPNFGGKRGMKDFDIDKATERLKADVASGKITQEKADEMLAKMKEKTAEFATRKAEMIAKQKEKIAKELADGKITQEQADKALANLADGKLMMPNFGGKRGMKEFDLDKATERLNADVASGKITQAQADEKLTKMKEKAAEFATRKAEMIAKQKERIAKELADGTITQEQADKALARLAEGKLMMPRANENPKMKKFNTENKSQDS